MTFLPITSRLLFITPTFLQHFFRHVFRAATAVTEAVKMKSRMWSLIWFTRAHSSSSRCGVRWSWNGAFSFIRPFSRQGASAIGPPFQGLSTEDPRRRMERRDTHVEKLVLFLFPVGLNLGLTLLTLFWTGLDGKYWLTYSGEKIYIPGSPVSSAIVIQWTSVFSSPDVSTAVFLGEKIHRLQDLRTATGGW